MCFLTFLAPVHSNNTENLIFMIEYLFCENII